MGQYEPEQSVSLLGRVATVSVTGPNPDEGATGPSQLGTGDDSTMMLFS